MNDSAGIHFRAAALIMKYSEKDDYGQVLKTDVPILHTCVHPANRAGVYTQGKACKTLLRNIGIDGFNLDEVNSNPIVIRERPRKDPTDTSVSFLEHNIHKSSLDPLLAGAYRESDPVVFANLAHCHIEQTRRALKRKLKWGHDVLAAEDGMRACDADGNLRST